jgi:hypothetical protein
MNSQQSGMMMACGLLALMILCMFSVCISVFIFAIFGLQESSLGPLMLGSMVGLISLLVYMSNRDDKKFEQEQVQSQLDYELHWQKRNLVNLATDFYDSRKNIAKRLKQAQIKHEREAKIKARSLNDDYDYGEDCCCDADEPSYSADDPSYMDD